MLTEKLSNHLLIEKRITTFPRFIKIDDEKTNVFTRIAVNGNRNSNRVL